MGMRQLGQLEAVVMAELWAADEPLPVRAVLERLQTGRELAYTTVMTVLENLRRKGLVERIKAGRAYDYRPLLSREEHTATLMQEVLAGGADRRVTLLRFAEQIPPAELASLRAALDAIDAIDGRQPPQ